MDPGLIYLAGLIKKYLATGHVWWHMPLVLTMAYTLFVRERLLDTALFDSYPNPLPQVKMRCNDPVLGKVISKANNHRDGVWISDLIIHQIFSLASDWSKRVTWANIPQLKLGNIRD